MIYTFFNSIYTRYSTLMYWFFKTNNSYYFLILSLSYFVLFLINNFLISYYIISIVLHLNLILLLLIGFFHIFLSMVSLINDYVYNSELNEFFVFFTILICCKIFLIFLI